MVNTPKLSRREEYARLTRSAVIEAAHRLFVANGYTATSIRAIATEARVSEQTVYRIFGDKAELLRAVILTAVGGSESPQVLRDSPRMAQLEALPTPAERLRVVAGWAREAYERGLADLENVVMAAAAADERVDALARYMAEQRYEDTRSVMIAVLGDTSLPAGVEENDVIDYLYAVESSAVYTLLAERGWTPDKYVAWFVQLFDRMFLSDVGESSV